MAELPLVGTSSRRPKPARGKRTPPARKHPDPRTKRPKAKKSLGQHFLQDAEILERIALAALPATPETVIEVGAGLGDLTSALSTRATRVIAVEKDDNLAARLKQRFGGTNVVVVHADALEVGPASLLALTRSQPPYVMAGNLPYNIAQPILRTYLAADPTPDRIVVMVQAEVAESIAAKPGKMSLLAVSIQLYAEAELLFRVPPSAFYPVPKVHSAVARLSIAPVPRADVDDVGVFFAVVRAGFAQRRKQLRNALANNLQMEPAQAEALLSSVGMMHTLRAQDISLEQWAALAKAWKASSGGGGKS